MLQSVEGSLTVVDMTSVFWNGLPVAGAIGVMIHADEDRQFAKIEVSGGDEAVLAEMEAAGIKIRRV